MTRLKMSFIRYNIAISPLEFIGLHRTNLRIPVEIYLMLLEINGIRIADGVWCGYSRNGGQHAECILQFCTHTINFRFDANRLQWLFSEVLDYR